MTATATPPSYSPPSAAAPSPSMGDAVPGPRSWVPNRSEWIDIAGLGSLIVMAVFGFGTAYGGVRYFVAGVIGTALGITVAFVCARTRQPLIVVVASIVVVFFVFGGAVAVPDEAFARTLPSPGAVLALIDGVVQGWAKLITTLPPVGAAGNLLTVPYVCGLLAGVIALTISLRSRRPLFALVPPVVVLGLSIMFGTTQPASLLVQGAAFAAVAIGWISLRQRRARRAGVGTSASNRWVGVIGMLVLAAVAAALFGHSMPGADSHNRFVLRDRTEPPFDPRDYPSPLNGYRRYTDPKLQQKAELFTVEGAEPGDRLRLATLDAYDGVIYTVGTEPGSSGYFQRVGEQIPVDANGPTRTFTVTIGRYSDVWVPTVGQLSSIEFLADQERAIDLLDSFRYNVRTGTAAAQALLREGDRYRIEAVVPEFDAETLGDGNAASVDQPNTVAIAPVQELGSQFAGDATSAYERAQNIAKQLVDNGAVSDGNTEEDQPESRPGHGAERLTRMVDPDTGVMVGNGEQYAPLAALMAQSVGVPARVVMGFEVPDDAPSGPVTVNGEDVTAWIEVAIDGAGWVPIEDVVPENTDPKEIEQPKPKPQPVAPPPPPPPLPPTEEDETDLDKVVKDQPKSCEELESEDAKLPERCLAGGLPWGTIAKVAGAVTLPLWILAAITAAIAALKLRRRQRRRTRGRPTDRIAGGWSEVTDLACDLGTPVPARATRREAAAFVGTPAVARLAAHTDGEIFGAGEPGEPEVVRYWDEVDGTRSAMVAELTRFERWKALVSLASLRPNGLVRRAPRRTGTKRTASLRDLTTNGLSTSR